MKHVLAITTAALMASATLAAPAFALDVGADVGVGADIGASSGSNDTGLSGNIGADTGVQVQTNNDGNDDASTDSGTTASTNSDANFDLVLSAVSSGDDNATTIQGMSDVSSVTVVELDGMGQANGMEDELESAINENEEEISSLQAAVEANADLNAELEQQSMDSSDVVAANVEANGSLTLYVK